MMQLPIQTIDVQTLKSLWENNPSLIVIDVRESDEWQTARIPGTHHIPKDIIAEQITTITHDKTQPIYLHCRSGMRSQIAAESLLSQGFESVYSVKGGILEWSMFGFPMLTSKKVMAE